MKQLERKAEVEHDVIRMLQTMASQLCQRDESGNYQTPVGYLSHS